MRHPLHPALVHFPIACWSLATALDLASLYWGRPAWHLAGILMLLGVLLSLPAMLAGFLELLKLADEHPAIGDVNRHMTMVFCATGLYVISLLMRLDGKELTEPGPLALASSVAGFVCLAVAGWLGGKLVYQHHLGIRPDQVADSDT